jgi:hypothetical protein
MYTTATLSDTHYVIAAPERAAGPQTAKPCDRNHYTRVKNATMARSCSASWRDSTSWWMTQRRAANEGLVIHLPGQAQ